MKRFWVGVVIVVDGDDLESTRLYELEDDMRTWISFLAVAKERLSMSRTNIASTPRDYNGLP